jgi:hypothetical protein
MTKDLLLKCIKALNDEMIQKSNEMEALMESLPSQELIGIFRIGEYASLILDKRMESYNPSESTIKDL